MFSYIKWGIKMKDILLFVAVISFFILGYHVIKRLDGFFKENRKRTNSDIEKKGSSSVKISGDMPLIDIDNEIDKFRESHPDFEIILRDESDLFWEKRDELK